MNEKMSGFRGILEHPKARGAAIFILLVVLGLAAWNIWNSVTPNNSVAAAESPLFIDSETGQTFRVKFQPGMHIPVMSPYTGRETGYVAELCYWTADGQIKSDPTAVLMNSDIGKPGPTFCPDCGRLVVVHNPNPNARPGMRPPPTEAEYYASHPRAANGN
jgi:hypothetical protein